MLMLIDGKNLHYHYQISIVNLQFKPNDKQNKTKNGVNFIKIIGHLNWRNYNL